MAAMASEDRRQIEERIDLRGRSLRQHAARGTIINSAFQVGLAGVGFLRRIIIAAFLTREEFGIWGILVTTLMTLAWLKEIGVSDKYVQQSEPDQELAFQKAFTIEFFMSLAFFALVAAALPIYAVAYGRGDIVVPGLVLALSVPISAFESPVWIAWRRMQFVRQRVLASIDPLSTAIVTVVLGVAGAGYWSLVVGTLAGSVIGATAAIVSCPYPIRLRFHRATTRDYVSFSWPLFGYQLSNLAITQGMLLVAARAVGVAAVGAIALASAIAAFADRVDTIVSETIYPAVCAVADRVDLLFESFIKSNRLAMMWGMPFGVGLALFAPDLVHFVLGDQWEPAIGLIAAFGLIAALKQVAFNWQVFMRAVGRTRPIFWSAIVNVVSFAAIIVPLVLAFGLTGYAVGNGIALLVQLAARGYFLRPLFPRFKIVRQFVRAAAPTVPAVGVVLLVRLVAGPEPNLAAAIAMFALYVLITAAATWVFERSLVTEILGYLRGGGGIRTRAEATQPTAAAVPEVPSGA
jgi:O-antigen/teichoic acid export membrane protein